MGDCLTPPLRSATSTVEMPAPVPISLSFLFSLVVSAAWAAGVGPCVILHAGSLLLMGEADLAQVAPRDFSRLAGLDTTDLSRVLPHLPTDIFAYYDGPLGPSTVSAMSGSQLAHYAEHIAGPICASLVLKRISLSAIKGISPRCLIGALLSPLNHASHQRLLKVGEEAFKAVVNEPRVCSRFNISVLRRAGKTRLAHVTPPCFAVLQKVASTDLSPILPHLRDDIFANYDYKLHSSTVAAMRPAQLFHFGADLRRSRICQELDLTVIQPTTFASISNRCLLGILSESRLAKHLDLFAHISASSFQFLMTAHRDQICPFLPATVLFSLPLHATKLLDSQCFAAMVGIEQVDLTSVASRLPDHILEYYDGPLWYNNETGGFSPKQLSNFAAKINRPLSCSKIQLRSFPYEAIAHIPRPCLKGHILSGNSLGAHWRNFFDDGYLSSSFFLEVVESLQEDDIRHIPLHLWDLLYDSRVKEMLPSIYRNLTSPDLLVDLVYRRSAFVWLAHALRTATPTKAVIAEKARIRELKLPTSLRSATIKSLQQRKLHWTCGVVEAILVSTIQEAEAVLIKPYTRGNSHPRLPLMMKEGVFDFDESFGFVVSKFSHALSKTSYLEYNGYIDGGGPMRQWLDQMLGYIAAKGMLRVTATGEVYFEFLAGPSVAIFVATVYWKALQQKVMPPLPLDTSFMSLLQGDVALIDGYFERLYDAHVQHLVSTIRGQASEEQFGKYIQRCILVEPETIRPWDPQKGLPSIYPEMLLEDEEMPASAKIYTAEAFYGDYVPRLREHCKRIFLSLVSSFRTVSQRIFDLQHYQYLLDPDVVLKFYGESVFSAKDILESTTFNDHLLALEIPSLDGSEMRINFKDFFTGIIHSLGTRELCRFVAVMSGSQYLRIKDHPFTVELYTAQHIYSAQNAHGAGLFIDDLVYEQILDRLVKYHRNVLGIPLVSVATASSFESAHIGACYNVLHIRPQRAHALFLSLLHQLNYPPQGMDDDNR